jgi:uncharacterized membrane protein HdeD (DUF308 family)
MGVATMIDPPRDSVLPSDSSAPTLEHELRSFCKEWWCFMLLGGSLVVLGIIAIGAPILMTVGATVLLGVLLLVAGAEVLISSFWTGKWSGFLIHILVGVMYLVVGLLIVDSPAEAAAGITLLIAALLIVGGIFRMVAALAIRFDHWGWVLLNGGISLILGIMIYERWPSSGLWVIGLFLGIELILNGWSWIATSLVLRRFAQEAEEAIS